MFRLIPAPAAVALALSCALASASPARADDAKTLSPAALVHKECGACHIAYLPRFLPSRAWEALMDHLDNHFGENAQLPPDELAVIRKYYWDHGDWGSWTPTEKHPMPRITDLPWWRKAMGGLDVNKPRIRSRANCGACHTHADWYMGVRE